MHTVEQEYIIDKEGNKKSVILPFSEWQKILNDIEELDDIRAYDKAKTKKSNPIPFDNAVKEIRESRSG